MMQVRFRSGLLIVLSGVALSACLDVGGSSPSNGAAAVTPPEAAQPTPVTTGAPADVVPVAPTPNSVPVISGAAATQAMAGTRYEFQPSASDGDGDPLVFSATGMPAWASIDSRTGLVSGTPTTADAGQTADIIVAVSDGKIVSSLPAFRIAVTAPAVPPPAQTASNTAPKISGTPGATVQALSGYSFRPNASDPEGQALTFSIANKPSWAAFSSADGTLSGTPGRDQDATYSNIVISVSDGSLSASLPAFSIVVSPRPNAAPTISGSPPASLTAGMNYGFQPTAKDADGDPLTFTISGKPAWAAFDAPTGAIWGTPTTAQAGTYGNIVISVSDGRATVSLPAFSIVVNRPTVGAATLSWSAPVQNTDGSSITDLSGYKIYYGSDPGSLGTTIQISNSGITTYVVDNLQSGTYYFAVTAYNAAGAESDRSAVGSKSIP